MPLFPKKVVNFGYLTNEVESERGKQGFSNKVVVFNAASVLVFEYKKMPVKRVPKNIIQLVSFNDHKGKSAKEIRENCKTKLYIELYHVLKMKNG